LAVDGGTVVIFMGDVSLNNTLQLSRHCSNGSYAVRQVVVVVVVLVVGMHLMRHFSSSDSLYSVIFMYGMNSDVFPSQYSMVGRMTLALLWYVA
jgi:hypothetical protein